MTLEVAFHALDRRLAELEQSFDNVQWAVVQGQDDRWSHAVLDHYEAAAHDALGLLHEARAAGTATDRQPELVRLRTALVTTQHCFNQLSIHFFTRLISYERKTTLYSLKHKGRAWATWIEGVDDALAQCQPPLYAVSQALLECWQELVDRAELLYVSTQLNSVGTGKIVIEGGSVSGPQPELVATSTTHDSTS